MVAVSASVIPNVLTSANFLARMKAAISDPIKGTGAVTQTADTGQINWATPVTPNNNGFGGFEMFAFADALQATYPIFVRLDYGWGGSTTNPQVRVQVGTATDGAGTLTGVTGTPQAACNGGATAYTNNTVAGTCYANGSAADAALLWGGWLSGTNGGGMFLVERSRDFDGTPNADGVVVQRSFWLGSATVMSWVECYRFTPPGVMHRNSLQRTGGMILLGGNGSTATTAIVGADTYLYPYFTGMYGTSLGGPSKYVVGAHRGDIAAGTVIAVTIYGQSRSFFAGGTGLAANHDMANTSGAAMGLCLRID